MASKGNLAVVVVALLQSVRVDCESCSEFNFCNGHGTCVEATSTCSCFEGWGAATDMMTFKAPDCSLRTCPAGLAWGDVATSATSAHALAECSNRGICDHGLGECRCFDGFTGAACQRTTCPNDCSGHGKCLSMRQIALLSDSLPLVNGTFEYDGDEDAATWDQDKLFGCVCDSSWDVGLKSGQRQQPEYFGHDCSLRHCPSGDDPRTSLDETDCQNVTAAGGFAVGEAGNLCHVDCSNRGICDYNTGLCKCFSGFYGRACGSISVLAD